MMLMSMAANKLKSERGQATTEYAILVAVLVVMAIIAIAAFRDNLQNLWDAIVSNINGIKPPEKSIAIVKIS